MEEGASVGEGVGGERDRETETERDREREPFGSSFFVFFLPPGPVLCKSGLARIAILTT